MIDPLKEFYRLIDSDEPYCLHKAKAIAIEHNFSDEVIADAIRPYKTVDPRNNYVNFQLRVDSFWSKQEWANGNTTSFFKL